MSPAAVRKAVRHALWSSLRERRREFRGVAAWSAVEALPAFLSGRLVAQALDHGFLAHRAATGFAWLGVLGASALVGAWGTRQTYLRLAALVEPFRDELVTVSVVGALRRSTVPGAATDNAGVARLTQQVEIVREAYASLLLVGQGFVVTSVSALLGLLTLDASILVLVLPPLLLGLGLFARSLTRLAARQRTSILVDEHVAEATSALAGGLRDVIACGAEDKLGDTVSEHIDAQARATTELARLTAVRTLAVGLGGWLPIVLVLVGGRWLVSHGATTGTILGALTYISQDLNPGLEGLVRGVGGPGLWLFVTLGRVLEAADVPEAPRVSDAPRGRDWPLPSRHDVRLRNVTFGYGPWAEPVIRELDLAVPDGEHLAVAGPSGVGKSTLAGLITGMLEPQAGEVRIGGVPLGDLDIQTLARHRVLIPQEAYVFAGTLHENVAYLREDVPVGEIERAVAHLGMDPLVERLGGYEFEIQPSALSAGERQLVALARAYLSEARLVVLDEATCHLDPVAEAQVEHAFAQRPGTLVVIAHRISSGLRADRILLLDGTQALVGPHEGLLRQSALYGDLVGHWQSGAVVGS
jgi:ATP-binding cassette subfamily C protein